jgi:hypothetical protein
VGGLLGLGPGQQPLLGDLVDQTQQAQMAFDQHGAGSLVATVLGGPLPNTDTLVFGNREEPIPALFAAGQDISGVELAGGATAIGFTAFTVEQIKGALDHGLGALKSAQGSGRSGIGAPELLAESGQVVAQSESLIYIPIQIASAKLTQMHKSQGSGAAPSK